MDLSYPYTKSNQLYTCPSDTSANCSYTYPMNGAAGRGSYLINLTHKDNGSGGQDPATGSRYGTPPTSCPEECDTAYNVKSAQIAAPATTAWVWDGLTQFGPVGSCGPNFQCATSWPIGTTNGMPSMNSGYLGLARHLETLNILYVDGHVKSQKLQNLWAYKTSRHPSDRTSSRLSPLKTIERKATPL